MLTRAISLQVTQPIAFLGKAADSKQAQDTYHSVGIATNYNVIHIKVKTM